MRRPVLEQLPAQDPQPGTVAEVLAAKRTARFCVFFARLQRADLGVR